MSDTVDSEEFLRYHGYPTVLAFQAAYGMKQDGINGPVTQAAMTRRAWCGVPDNAIVSPVRWGPRDWINNPKLYRFESYDDALPRNVVQRIFRESFSAWEKVCGVRFAYTEDVEADIWTTFGPIDGPGRTLAWAELQQGDLRQSMRFDTAEIFVDVVSERMREVDLGNVASHEIGHILHLQHIPIN